MFTKGWRVKMADTQSDPCLYSVGATSGGMTTLRISSEDGYSSMTLSMGSNAVRQMIRLLEATLPDEDDEEEIISGSEKKD